EDLARRSASHRKRVPPPALILDVWVRFTFLEPLDLEPSIPQVYLHLVSPEERGVDRGRLIEPSFRVNLTLADVDSEEQQTLGLQHPALLAEHAHHVIE